MGDYALIKNDEELVAYSTGHYPDVLPRLDGRRDAFLEAERLSVVGKKKPSPVEYREYLTRRVGISFDDSEAILNVSLQRRARLQKLVDESAGLSETDRSELYEVIDAEFAKHIEQNGKRC